MEPSKKEDPHSSKVSRKSQLVRCALHHLLIRQPAVASGTRFPVRTRQAFLLGLHVASSLIPFPWCVLWDEFLGVFGVGQMVYEPGDGRLVCASDFYRGLCLPAVCGNAGVLNFSPDFWKSVEFFRFFRKDEEYRFRKKKL